MVFLKVIFPRTYENVKTTSTVAVGAQWFTSAKEDEQLIYNITKALWNKVA